MNDMYKENYSLCLVFPMGIEAYPFLRRVETRHRLKIGKAILRVCFFEGNEFLVLRSGIGPERAASAIRSLSFRVESIVSVGTAGALAADLSLGQMVVVSETVNASKSDLLLESNQLLVEKLTQACLQTRQSHIVSRLATNHKAVFSRGAREALNQKTSACAVDMESHSMALEARNRGCAFAGLRVISDTVDSGSLPAKVDLRSLVKDPLRIGQKLAPFLKWRTFMKQFFFAISRLDPVLINFLRSMRQM